MPHCTFIRDGKTCGAPSYQDPCASCIAWARSLAERGLLTSVPTPMSVNARASQASYEPRAPSYEHQTGPGPSYVSSPSKYVPSNALMNYARYRTYHTLLHHLWTKSVGAFDYQKRDWQALENAVNDIAQNGLGDPAPVPIARSYGEDRTVSLGPAYLQLVTFPPISMPSMGGQDIEILPR